ncbi:hypothetical protein AQJ43_23605 [Streptomyces avermitilis]|uniref:Uncharacterized protein n=2 Tax=Streptomyces avermitilis TaxID=33903 RepID=A0A4D4MQQ1_STRAX|nr:hypothetical protein AQJ43_23605 [Streptomyces avermitilis]GDY74076.1 hypothetical protein SAV31267_035610 [Streptomyces avermitilis]GDY83145.1 hypothetical protein SAVCW2_23440 [Streptomyces avermitilis]
MTFEGHQQNLYPDSRRPSPHFPPGEGLVRSQGVEFKFGEVVMAEDRCVCDTETCWCGYIPPGGTAEQAMAMLADDEPEVFDGDW